MDSGKSTLLQSAPSMPTIITSLNVGKTYVTRSGHRVLIKSASPGRSFGYLGLVVYESGTALITFDDKGKCCNSRTPELDIIAQVVLQ